MIATIHRFILWLRTFEIEFSHRIKHDVHFAVRHREARKLERMPVPSSESNLANEALRAPTFDEIQSQSIGVTDTG
jgi:hypothetical protein